MYQPEYTADENRCAEEWKKFFALLPPEQGDDAEDDTQYAHQFRELAAKQRARHAVSGRHLMARMA